MVEILAPAGDEACFYAAVSAGADAIYIGLKEFSARSAAENFNVENAEKYIRYAHFFGIKVYVAVNTLIKDGEIPAFLQAVEKTYSAGADAFILQDPFLGRYIKEHVPDICLHLSTQAGVCNIEGARFALECGFSRVILARETSPEDARKISSLIETESFVQGALCTCFSGHCYMSSFIGGLSGNRGRCKQPCRKKYTFSDDEPLSYALSTKDLCLKDEVNKLLDCGITSFKIEGRMRSPDYVYSAVMVYKDALAGRQSEYLPLMRSSYNRGNYTKGFFGRNTSDIIYPKNQANIGDFVGYIKRVSKGVAEVDTDGKFDERDGFKILSQGVEVCGAVYLPSAGRGAKFAFRGNVSVGDEVRITKNFAFYDRVVSEKRKEKIDVIITAEPNKRAVARLKCQDKSIDVQSDNILEPALKSPLTQKDFVDCFLKTDEYPFETNVEVVIHGDVFMPKSALNAFRRKAFSCLYLSITDIKRQECSIPFPKTNPVTTNVKSTKNLYISSDFNDFSPVSDDSVFVYKPSVYDKEELLKTLPQKSLSKAFLYLPPFATGRDLEDVASIVNLFAGVYTEGYYGIVFARDLGLDLIAGTGCNIFNSVDVGFFEQNAKDYVFSKELSLDEIRATGGNGFILSAGGIQLMDLIYCPSGANCASCKKKSEYSMTDEEGRRFPVRRYRMRSCRFEIYNPYLLVSSKNIERNAIDLTCTSNEERKALLNSDVSAIERRTYGNLQRGVK